MDAQIRDAEIFIWLTPYMHGIAIKIAPIYSSLVERRNVNG
jgi:hypothetical protein